MFLKFFVCMACNRYLRDPENFFVISSDFCHWGERFRFFFFLLRRTRLVRNPVDLVAALHPKPYLNPV